MAQTLLLTSAGIVPEIRDYFLEAILILLKISPLSSLAFYQESELCFYIFLQIGKFFFSLTLSPITSIIKYFHH